MSNDETFGLASSQNAGGPMGEYDEEQQHSNRRAPDRSVKAEIQDDTVHSQNSSRTFESLPKTDEVASGSDSAESSSGTAVPDAEKCGLLDHKDQADQALQRLNPQLPPLFKLRDKYYVLLDQITDGQTSIVWKAVQLVNEPDPELFYPIEKSGDAPLEWLRKKEGIDRSLRLKGLTIPEGRSVALKIARDSSQLSRLRSEFKTLTSFGHTWHEPNKAQVVAVVEKIAPSDDLPILVLEWLNGPQLDRLPPQDEEKGLLIAYQLVTAIITALTVERHVLTDTIKSNSLFWDETAQSLILADWNVLGKPTDFRKDTLPIFGGTLYRLLTGNIVPTANDGSIDLDKLAQTVAGLSFGSVTLIGRTLLQDFEGNDPDDLAKELHQAVEEYRELWSQPEGMLLLSARSSTGVKAVMQYDVARTKLENRFERTDEDQFCAELKRVVANYAQPTFSHYGLALLVISWAWKRYPDDRDLRLAWLAHRAAYDDPENSRVVMEVLVASYTGQFAFALTRLSASRNPSVVEAALHAEIRFWECLERGERRPTLESAREVNTAFDDLRQIWERKAEGLGSSSPIPDLNTKVEDYVDRVTEIDRLQAALIKHLERGEVSKASETLRRLNDQRPGLADLPLWIKAVDCLASGTDEDSRQSLSILRPHDTALQHIRDPHSGYALSIVQIAADRLRQAAKCASAEDCCDRAIGLIEAVVRALGEDGDAQYLSELEDRRNKYTELQRRFRNAQSLDSQEAVLNEWIGSGFSLETDGEKPLASLFVLRFDNAFKRAEYLVGRGDYLHATAVLSDQAIVDLQKSRDAVQKANDALKRHGLETRVDLEGLATDQIRAWKDQQRQLRAEELARAKDRIEFYASAMPIRPTKYLDALYSVEAMIDDLLSHVRDGIKRTLQIDDQYDDALAAQLALDAFQRGRLALRHRDFATAASQLILADRYGWNGLKGLLRPYLDMAKRGQSILSVSISIDAKSVVDRLVACANIQQEADNHQQPGVEPVSDSSTATTLQEADNRQQVADNIFDPWLQDIPVALSREIRNQIEADKRNLQQGLKNWLTEWPHLAAGGNALEHRGAYRIWVDLFEAGKRNLPDDSDLWHEFDRWQAEVAGCCNADLARALLVDAQAHVQQQRDDLAREAEAEACRLVTNNELADEAESRGTPSNEVSRLIADLWRSAFVTGNVSTTLDRFEKMLGARPGLKQLAQQLLQEPEPKSINSAFEMLARPDSNVEQFVSVVQELQPESAASQLSNKMVEYSYAKSADYVKKENYATAEERARVARYLHDGDSNAARPLIDALKTELGTMWQTSLKGTNPGSPTSNWYDAIKCLFADLDKKDTALKSLLEEYLIDPPSADLGEQCDKWIKGDLELNQLVQVLSHYSPNKCRTIFYHAARAATFVDKGDYELALKMTENGNFVQDDTVLQQAIDRALRKHCSVKFNRKEYPVTTNLKEALRVDSSLLELWKKYGTYSLPVDEMSAVAEQILGTIVGDPDDLFHLPDKDEFTNRMLSVRVDQWDTKLRDGLRVAFARRYERQARSVSNKPAIAQWIWWFRRDVQKEINDAKCDAIAFNTEQESLVAAEPDGGENSTKQLVSRAIESTSKTLKSATRTSWLILLGALTPVVALILLLSQPQPAKQPETPTPAATQAATVALDVAVNDGQLVDIGTVQHELTVTNTSTTTTTFHPRFIGISTENVRLRLAQTEAPAPGGSGMVLQPNETRRYILTVYRRAADQFAIEPRFEIDWDDAGSGQSLTGRTIEPVKQAPRIALSVDPMSMVQTDPMSATIAFTPTLAAEYVLVCQDGQEQEQSTASILSSADRRYVWLCPISKGEVGVWSVSVLPSLNTEHPDAAKHARLAIRQFIVLQEKYGGHVIETGRFDPNPTVKSVGVHYVLINMGDQTDTFWVEYVPTSHALTLTLALTDTAGITNEVIFPKGPGRQSLGLQLAAGQIMTINAIVAHDAANVSDGSRDLKEPIEFVIRFISRHGLGDPIVPDVSPIKFDKLP